MDKFLNQVKQQLLLCILMFLMQAPVLLNVGDDRLRGPLRYNTGLFCSIIPEK